MHGRRGRSGRLSLPEGGDAGTLAQFVHLSGYPLTDRVWIGEDEPASRLLHEAVLLHCAQFAGDLLAPTPDAGSEHMVIGRRGDDPCR